MSVPAEHGPKRMGLITGFVLLCIRGVLLWIVVPAGVLIWLPWWMFSRNRSGLGRFLGWLDLNLIAAVEHTVLRPFVSQPLPWTPTRQIPFVSHRLRFIDPA